MGGSCGSRGGEKCIQCKHCNKEVEGNRPFQVYVDDNTKTDLNEIGFAYVNFFQLAQCRFE